MFGKHPRNTDYQQGDLLIEIGGNVGTETVGFADIVGSQGRVVVFEPDNRL